jgi:Ca2+-binding EF-hand superfamily protein
MDREPNSRPGAIVDEYGVEITEHTIVELLNVDAIRRSDVESYLMAHRMQGRARRGEALPIPDKFKRADANGDGYVSFDELLKTINDFFDGSSTYTPNDIKELNDFFFEQ